MRIIILLLIIFLTSCDSQPRFSNLVVKSIYKEGKMWVYETENIRVYDTLDNMARVGDTLGIINKTRTSR